MDAVTPVVAGIITCNGVVAGRVEADADPVAAGIITCNSVVAGILNENAVLVVADSIV